MLIGFSKYGTGAASSAISYLTATHDTKGMARTPEPQILRGDPGQIEHLIDSLPFAWKYTSGVLSFSESALPAETENVIMDEFENTAFAGLEEDRHAMLWVKHGHAGRTELHFLTPRAELASGKSLNIAPPGKASRELFDTLRSKINVEHGLTDPEDPARARTLKLPSFLARLKAREAREGQPSKQDTREAITACVEAQMGRGLIKSRDDLLSMLRREGFAIPRCGEDYITIEDSTRGERVRLKGALYAKRALAKDAAPGDTQRDLAALTEKLRRLTEARARYNRERYEQSATKEIEPLPVKPHTPDPDYDRTGNCSLAGFEGIGARIHGTRATTERLCRPLNDAARRFFGATSELARGTCAARDASERFGRTAHSFGTHSAETIGRFRQQEMTNALFAKYGVACARANAHRAPDIEPEPEL